MGLAGGLASRPSRRAGSAAVRASAAVAQAADAASGRNSGAEVVRRSAARRSLAFARPLR